MNISSIVSSVVSAANEITSVSESLKNLIFGSPKENEYNIDKIANLDRPATTFRWACFMPEKLMSYGKNEGIELGKIEKECVSSCDITLPLFSSIDNNSIVYSNTRYIGVKKPDLGTLNIEFYESFYYPILQYFSKWDKACCSKTGTYKPLKARVGIIKLVAYDIENYTAQLACEFYVIPTSTLSLKFNGDSDRQKPKFDFKILHYEVISYNEASKNDTSVNDVFSSLNKFF